MEKLFEFASTKSNGKEWLDFEGSMKTIFWTKYQSVMRKSFCQQNARFWREGFYWSNLLDAEYQLVPYVSKSGFTLKYNIIISISKNFVRNVWIACRFLSHVVVFLALFRIMSLIWKGEAISNLGHYRGNNWLKLQV